MSEIAIQISGLVKYFGGRCVLKGLDLAIPKGSIYGLLGRNGVGKTTMIRILLGLDSATRGSTALLGQDSQALTSQTKSRVGYVAEGHHLIQSYRVKRLIQLCRSLSPTWNGAFFDHLIKTFRLPLDRRVKALSAGMRAQLNLALAMAADPEVLILDDPTLGLDTVARRQFLELAIDLIQRQDKTILFSSHILADVERIADRVGILVNGSLVVDCDLESLKQRVTQVRVIFKESPPPSIPLADVIRCHTEGREVLLTTANWTDQKRAMIEALGPTECCEKQMSLEDIFLECTGSQSVVFNHEEVASHA